MKKNKITFFAMELILLVLALFFVWKIFIQNVPEKRVAVILPTITFSLPLPDDIS